MPELNEKLIACVLRHLEQHPEEYEQNDWCSIHDLNQDGDYCGTKGCMAGWTVLLSTPVEQWKGLPSSVTATYPGSGHSWYAKKAQELLGLTDNEAARLFKGASGDPHRDLQELKARLRVIRYNRGLPMDGPAAEEVKDA